MRSSATDVSRAEMDTKARPVPSRHQPLPTARDQLVLADLVEAFGNPDAGPDRLRDLASRLAATGAHSGADLLAGALALVRGVVGVEETA